MRIDLLHGPNLNLLGTREPAIYGSLTLDALVASVVAEGSALGAEVVAWQGNGEGAMVDRIHAAAAAGTAGVVINAGGYTHTSVAIRDALLGVGVPYVEVHLSNVHAREPFRHRSLLADRAVGVVSGLGRFGYGAALRCLIARADTD